MTYQATANMQLESGQQARRGVPNGYMGTPVGAHDMNNMHVHQAGPALVGGMPADDGMGTIVNQFGTLNLGGGNMGPGNAGMPAMPHSAYMNGADGNIVFATSFANAVPPMVDPTAPYGATYPVAFPGHGFVPSYPGALVPFTPARPVSYENRVPRDLPALENRRGSYSTSATESTPATPFFGQGSDRLTGTRVASLDRSAYTTPSPRETISQYVGNNIQMKVMIDPDLDSLLMKDPPVPKAVPAVWTDHVKPLEQCLENRIQGNKNVYIRGLHPTTDDDLLLKYADRFGPVEQSKAIIDTATSACKGFGFAKYKNVHDSENAIRGFYKLGYEVGFARESFNARLKAEGDDNSTNLYISNLPKDINENMLIHIFEPFHIVSSKILRDSMGNSRGVGFARFETREICEKVIKTFHGLALGQEGYVMQVRYADTPAQKELKRITAERRQYRTNEYNIGAYGTHAVGMTPSIYTQPGMWSRRPGPSTYNGVPSARAPNHGNATNNGVQNGGNVQGATRGQARDTTASGTASSDDGSGDEGVTIVDSPVVAKGSTQSSPTVKKEKQ